MSVAKLSILLAAAAWNDSAATELGPPTLELPPARERGKASWYGDGRLHGRITASGEPIDPDRFTCAHRSIPLQTTVLLVNQKDSTRRVWCRVNDRGPYGVTLADGSYEVQTDTSAEGRYRNILDVSVGAARQLGTYGQGRQQVAIHYWSRNTRAREPLALALEIDE